MNRVSCYESDNYSAKPAGKATDKRPQYRSDRRGGDRTHDPGVVTSHLLVLRGKRRRPVGKIVLAKFDVPQVAEQLLA